MKRQHKLFGGQTGGTPRPEAESEHAERTEVTPEAEPIEENAVSDAPEAAPEEEKSGRGQSLWMDLAAVGLRIGWIALVLAAVLLFLVGIMTQRGQSMAPSIRAYDVVLYYRLDHQPKAGEVVVFRGEDGTLRTARVAAVAGDTVEVDEVGLKLNGYYQDTGLSVGTTVRFEGGPDYPLTLAEGELFVLYDTRSEGGDSRSFGPLRADELQGRVMLVLRHRDF